MDLDDELLDFQQSQEDMFVAPQRQNETGGMNDSSDLSPAMPQHFAATNEVVMSYNNSEKESKQNGKSFEMKFDQNTGKIVAPQLSTKVPQLKMEKLNKFLEPKDKKVEPKKLSTSVSSTASSNFPRKNNPLTSSTNAISKLKPKEPSSSTTTKKSNPFLSDNQPLPLEKKKVSQFAKEEIEQFMLQQKLKRLKQKEQVISAKEAEKKKQKEKLEVCFILCVIISHYNCFE